jgi:hypothetical protein
MKMVLPKDGKVRKLRDEAHANLSAKSVHDYRKEIVVQRVDEDLVDELIAALESVPNIDISWHIRPDHELAQSLAEFAEFLHHYPRGAYNCDFTSDSHYIKSIGRIYSALRLFSRQSVSVYAKLYLITHHPQPVSRAGMALAECGLRRRRGAGSLRQGRSAD